MSYTFALRRSATHASVLSKKFLFYFLLSSSLSGLEVTPTHHHCFRFTHRAITAAFSASTPRFFVHTMSMSDSSSDSSTTTDAATYRDAPTTLLRFPLPECTHSQFRNYLEKTADMFHHLIFDYHQEKQACEDHGTQWQPDDALHETAYQTQLLTMAFWMDITAHQLL